MNKYAILIGINNYHESLGNLKYAGADCRRLQEVLLSGNFGFEEERMLLLDDTQEDERKPTFANIHTWLSSWLAQPKKDDLVLFYYAGHGRDMDNKSYLVPGDATLSTLHTLGIPLANIQELMGRCKARNKILIIDACHSGAGRDVAPMSVNWQDNLSQSKGIYTVTSCGVDELSHEWADKSQGVFSWFLSEALSGHCPPNADGKLTIERIYEWVYDKVTNWAANHRCKQTPQRFSQGSGVITLAETEPDYKALVDEMRIQLGSAQKQILDLQASKIKPVQPDRRPKSAVSKKISICPGCGEKSSARSGSYCSKCKSFVHTNCAVKKLNGAEWGPFCLLASRLYYCPICKSRLNK